MANRSNNFLMALQSFLPLSGTRLAWTTIAISLILGLWFNYSFWQQLPGLSLITYVLFATALVWWLTRVAQSNWPKPLWAIVFLELLFSAFITWHASTWLTLFNLAAMFGLALLAVKVLCGQPWQTTLTRYLTLLVLPFSWLKPARQTLQYIAIPSPSDPQRQQIKSIISGLLIALPAVILLLILFASGDPIFASYLPNLSQFSIQPQIVAQIIVILAVTAWFVAAFSPIIWRQDRPELPHTEAQRLSPTESTIVLFAVNLVFALFLLTQLVYLFGGETYLAAHHTTYAQYARQGFTQLVLTAIVAAAMLWLTKPQLPNPSARTRALGSALCIQVLIVLASAMSRLWLYEQAYGFTIARLTGHTIMIWLMFAFIILLIQIIRHFNAIRTGSLFLGLTLGLLITLNLINPENFIVQQNIARYHQTGKIDLSYLSRLSADTVPALVTFQHQADAKTADQLHFYLTNHYTLNNYPTSWQSWNYSRHQACHLLPCSHQPLSLKNSQ